MEFNHVKIPRIRLKKGSQPVPEQNSVQCKNNSNLIKMIKESRKEEGCEEEEEQVIRPKKLVNPIKESVAMQSIHRELLLNQKIGYNVLKNKSELERALEKLSTKPPQPPNPPEQPQPSVPNKKLEFESILKARARQIEEQKCFVDGVTTKPSNVQSEFEKIHRKITHNNEDKK